MKKILFLIIIMFMTGCVHKFDVQKANTYLMLHSYRPVNIQEALLEGRVVEGMNEEEVFICLGKPNAIMTVKNPTKNFESITWRYGNPPRERPVKMIMFREVAVIDIRELNSFP